MGIGRRFLPMQPNPNFCRQGNTESQSQFVPTIQQRPLDAPYFNNVPWLRPLLAPDPLAKRIVDPCLPALPVGTEVIDHIL